MYDCRFHITNLLHWFVLIGKSSNDTCFVRRKGCSSQKVHRTLHVYRLSLRLAVFTERNMWSSTGELEFLMLTKPRWFNAGPASLNADPALNQRRDITPHLYLEMWQPLFHLEAPLIPAHLSPRQIWLSASNPEIPGVSCSVTTHRVNIPEWFRRATAAPGPVPSVPHPSLIGACTWMYECRLVTGSPSDSRPKKCEFETFSWVFTRSGSFLTPWF